MRIGIIGIGFMGSTHFVAAQSLTGVQVTAIATRDRKKHTGDWTDISGNLGTGGGTHDLSAVHCYERWEDLIQDPDVDLVDVCTPTGQHAAVTLAALAAGKHVLVEKPIATSVAEGQAMLDAAKAAGRRLFVAQVLPFFPEHAWLRRQIAAGAYGEVLAARFKRIVSCKDPAAWQRYVEGSGGPIRDLNVHDVDFIHKAFGVPDWVHAAGPLVGDAQSPWVSIQYGWDDTPRVVTAEAGAITMPGRAWQQGFDVFFERGTVQYDTAFGRPLELLTADGAITTPEIPQADAFAAEIEYVRRSLAGAESGDWMSGENGLLSLRLCEVAEQSLREGGRVRVKA